MSELEKRRERAPVHYVRPAVRLHLVAVTKRVPRRRARQMHPGRVVLKVVGPMLLVGVGAILFWLGYLL